MIAEGGGEHGSRQHTLNVLRAALWLKAFDGPWMAVVSGCTVAAKLHERNAARDKRHHERSNRTALPTNVVRLQHSMCTCEGDASVLNVMTGSWRLASSLP